MWTCRKMMVKWQLEIWDMAGTYSSCSLVEFFQDQLVYIRCGKRWNHDSEWWSLSVWSFLAHLVCCWWAQHLHQENCFSTRSTSSIAWLASLITGNLLGASLSKMVAKAVEFGPITTLAGIKGSLCRLREKLSESSSSVSSMMGILRQLRRVAEWEGVAWGNTRRRAVRPL